jgi:SAM-dependent methyltransferase
MSSAPLKVHIGCGSVFLTDYLNIDVAGPKTFLAIDRPDLVERWGTTDDAYFAKHQDKTQASMAKGPLDQEYVCDRFGDFEHLGVPSWSVDEVLARHSFEHLSLTEAHRALDAIDEVLKPGAILRLDVPDHEETIQLLRGCSDELFKFYERHLLGPRRNDFGYHLCGYSRERLKALVADHGFVFVSEERNIHCYPAFTLQFRKPFPRAPWEYVAIDVPAGARFLDVGPGPFPHPRAHVYLDNDPVNVARLTNQGKKVILGDIENGLPHVGDKAFDYAWASHCFEHFNDPAKAAATLSRIAKAGTIVMPSAHREALTNFEERSHLWSVLDHPTSGQPPIFVRATPERLDTLRDVEVMKSFCRLFRTGPNRRITEEGRLLRKWWCDRDAELDVVYHWKDELKLTVIG